MEMIIVIIIIFYPLALRARLINT